MQDPGTQEIMDYTTVPVGLVIEGKLWTGHRTSSTATCPECGRNGVMSTWMKRRQIIVHCGRIEGNTLVGIDFCNLESDAT